MHSVCVRVGKSIMEMGAKLGFDRGKDEGEGIERNVLMLHHQKVAELRFKRRISDFF